MKARDIIRVLDALAPPALASDWDRAGLSVGDPQAEVSTVLVALTVTREAFEEALETQAQMIVSHHPLIWEPITSLRADDPESGLVLDIARAGLTCYSAHTNLDVAPGGVNEVLATRLGIQDLRPLFPSFQARQVKLVTFVPEANLVAVRDAVSAAGAGVIGDYTHCSFSAPGEGTFLPGDAANPHSGEKHRVNIEPERRFETLVPKVCLGKVLEALVAAHPYEEVAYDIVPLENTDPSIALGLHGSLAEAMTLGGFASFVREALDTQHVRVVGDLEGRVQRVAVLGGAGGGHAAELPPGIDVFVTGDVTYHEAQAAAARGVAVIDAGHHGTEKWIVPVLAAHLESQLDGLSVSTYIEPDCFKSIVSD